MTFVYEEVRRWLDEIGANLAGRVPSAAWAEWLPSRVATLPHRPILIFGAGGPEVIRRCQAHAAEHGELEHWLSDYAQALFERWAGGPSPRYLNPYRAGLHFPFQRAAVAAGIGVLGLNNMVLTPEFGPWFSLLGAIVLDDLPDLPHQTPFDPATGVRPPASRHVRPGRSRQPVTMAASASRRSSPTPPACMPVRPDTHVWRDRSGVGRCCPWNSPAGRTTRRPAASFAASSTKERANLTPPPRWASAPGRLRARGHILEPTRG